MGKCANDAKFKMRGFQKLKNTAELYFNVNIDPDRCVLINTRDYIDISTGTTALYNRYLVPNDAFDCLPDGCVNTGTLQLTKTDLADGDPSVTFRVDSDATEFYEGAMSYYVWVPEAGNYTVETMITDIGQATPPVNADTYEYTITATGEGFYPVLVDFSQAPSSVTGSGWQASEAGARVSVSIGNGEDEGSLTVGVSTFYFYDSIEDLEISTMVVISCMTEDTMDLTIDATDASCWGSGYDADSTAVEKTLTGNAITANYGALNPMEGKGEIRDWFVMHQDEREVRATTENGTQYGYIQIADWNEEECGFLQLGIADCRIQNTMFRRVMSPVPVALDERQFIIMDGSTDPLKAGKILVDASLIGQMITIYYAKREQRMVYASNPDNIGKKRVRMHQEICNTDGSVTTYTYNNVYVTTFPLTNLTNTDETPVALTLAIHRDMNNVFFYRSEEIA